MYFFDTAESYGPNLLPENRGHNEKIVGEAVHSFRQKVVLATKLHLNTEEVTEKGLETVVREHLEAALERIPMHGHRGFVEQQGSSMRNWNRK